MRGLVLPFAFLIVSLSAAAQTFSTTPAADTTTLTLITGKTFSAGDPIVLYTGASAAGCNQKYGVRISAPVVVAASGSTDINIQGKLAANDVVCGSIGHGKIDKIIKAVKIAQAGPSIVQAPQPPAGGDVKVQVSPGGIAVNGDPIILYSGISASACKPPFGHPISVDDSGFGTANPAVVSLQKPLTTGSFVCGLVGHGGSNMDLAAVAVVAPSTPTFFPDPTAGDQSLKVITGGAAASGDAVTIFTAKTDAACTAAMSGTALSVAASTLGATSTTVINLTDKLTEGNFVCGQVAHASQTLTIPSAKVVAATPGKPGVVGAGAPPAPGGKGAAAAPIFTVTLTNPSMISVQDTTDGVANVDVYAVTAGATPKCGKDTATLIALTDPKTDTVSKTGAATLALAKPLTTGTLVCAIDSTTATSPIYLYVQPQQPAFARPPFEGSGVVVVQATPSDPATSPAWTVGVQLKLLGDSDPCDAIHGVPIVLGAGGILASQTTDKNGSATFTIAPPLASGSHICALQTITVNAAGVKQLPLADPQVANGSFSRSIDSQTDWGLVRAYFTGGTVISNDSSNFSTANLFFALNVDKTWLMPGCAGCTSTQLYSTFTVTVKDATTYTLTGDHLLILGAALSADNTLIPANDAASGVIISGRRMTLKGPSGAVRSVSGAVRITGGTITPVVGPTQISRLRGGEMTITQGDLTIQGPGSMVVSGGGPRTTVTHNFIPGFNTFFDARLTAIPVAANPTNTTTMTTTMMAAAPATTPSFISTQKTARIGVGVYLPVLLTRWTWANSPNALFIAPEAKIGFDTITGAQAQNVILPGGAAGMQTYSQLYNYRSFGGRIGHMKLSGSPDKAPEIYSYLDIGFGPYSNLESLECNRTRYTADTPAMGTTPAVPGSPIAGQPTKTTFSGSQCTSAYPSFYIAPGGGSTDVYQVYETRKRIYRLDLEGLLKIPGTPLYVGFNANLGQKAVKAGMFDPQFKAPDDLRFFFGTKFDISTFLSKMGVNVGN